MSQVVSGAVQHDSANVSASGPVKVGAVYRATPPSVTDGDVVDLLADEAGRLQVDVASGSITAVLDTGATADLDSGAGTDTVSLIGVAVAASGGAVAITGDATNGLDVDVTRLPATTNAGATAKTSDYDTGAGTDTVTSFGIAVPASGGAVMVGGTANGLYVQGPAAHDSAAAGSPVRAGGVYRASAPAVTDGDVVDLLTDAAGRQFVTQATTTTGTHAQTTVDTTATGIEVVATGFSSCVITNQGAVDAYLGMGSVAANTGLKLAAGQSIGFSRQDGYSGQIKAITAASSTTFGVLRW